MRRWLPSSTDAKLLRTVMLLRVATKPQLKSLLYPTQKSMTSVSVPLDRLVRHGYLSVTRPASPFAGGGFNIYQATRQTFELFDVTDKYRHDRRKADHSLGIGECYVMLMELQRDGRLLIDGIDFEPDSWVRMSHDFTLQPDVYVRLVRSGSDVVYRMWIEVDLATEGPGVIKAKLRRYLRAWTSWDEPQHGKYPQVLWVAIDELRADALKRLIRELPRDDQRLFRVTSFAAFKSLF